MLKRFSTLVLVVSLVCALAGNSAFATTLSDPGTKANVAETRAEVGDAPKKAAKPNDRLRTDMVKLVADAKAGKVTPAPRPQIQPVKSNNLSKGAKIAIGVGIAVVVIALIVKYQKDHLFDCRSRCVL